MTKDATSTYFLNGTKCRRRDITEIFLGTGLGPRSYAIIEQGMISRLIESKPQELRVFLEEAAGISKYKERRRETETRIRHTRENLERLADVRDELGTQLDKLQKQANTAKQFKELKQQERQYKAELNALKWHKYNEQVNVFEQQRCIKETELEAFIAKQRGGELSLVDKKEALHELNEKIQLHQQQIFQTSNQITKLEQQILFDQERANQRQQESIQLTESINEAVVKIEQEQELLEALKAEVLEKDLEQEIIEERLYEAEQQLATAEYQHEQQQAFASQQVKEISHAQQALKIIDTKLHHQQLEQARNRQQHQDLSQELSDLTNENQQQALSQLENERQQLELKIIEFQDEHAKHNSEHQKKTENQTRCKNELDAAQAQQIAINSKLEQLTQWQQELRQGAQVDSQESADVKTLGLAIEQLKVQKKWQLAIESLMTHHGDLMLVESLPESSLSVAGNYLLASATLTSGDSKTSRLMSLEMAVKNSAASVIEAGDFPLWFNNVAVAESTIEAQTILENSNHFIAAVLPNGQWVGKNWTGLGLSAGALSKLEQLETLQHDATEIGQITDALSAKLEMMNTAVNESKLNGRRLEDLLNLTSQQCKQIELEIQLTSQQQRHVSAQKEKIQQELNRINQQSEDIELVLEALVEEQIQAQEKLLILEQKADKFEKSKSNSIEQKQTAKHALELATKDLHQFSMQQQALQNQTANLQQNIQTANESLTKLKSKLNTLADTSHHIADKNMLSQQLEELLESKLLEEEKIQSLNLKVAEIDEEILSLEKGQSGVHHQLDKMKDDIATIKMDCEGARVRAQNMLDVLDEMNVTIKNVLENMPLQANEADWQKNLEKTGLLIQRLGAINLAAIEEFDIQAERKQYLDDQYLDLTSALETLESAIRKIDRESRNKFKETYDSVNEGLQTLFPKVFGGGAAYLELTGDDLLETGVTIMARPPGKKNSTIHLLSGGEKALTALSLVFSIFKLNPAPFCMLDEVDAPLDDANVGRFCKLVNEMSDSVQFIYISHNKVAMEMATHLTGVTMQEPGVSRLVAVDIQQAVEMADAV